MSLDLGLGALAFLTSFVNGLLGAGGAVLLIPLALYIPPLLGGQQLDPHHVSGLVLVQSVASALGGGVGFHRHGHVDRGMVLTYGPVLAVGGLVGALASARLSGRALLVAFAVVTSAAAVTMLVRPRPGRQVTGWSHQLAAAVTLFAIALLGGVIGLGAAFLIIPVMLYLLAVPARVANGSSLVLSVFLTAPALIGKAATGQIIWFPAALIAVAAVAGSRFGAHLSPRVPVNRLRLGLAGLTALFAVRVWIDLL